MSLRNAWLACALLTIASPPVALQAQESGVRFGGEVRVRHELERPITTGSFDQFTLLRTRLGVQAALAEGARALIQFQDSRVFGEESSTFDASAELLDLHQGYLELVQPALGRQLTLRAGRQEMILGNERLVGAVGWSNTGRSFDGARLDVAAPDGGRCFSVFAATVAERGERFSAGAEDDDHLFAGLTVGGGPLEAWLLHDRAATYRSFTGVDRTTLGARADVALGGAFDAWLEGAYQAGNQVQGVALDQDIGAWFAGGRLSWDAAAGALTGLSAGVDYLSGDEDPLDGNYGAFNTLYATNHKWYGYLDLFLDPAGRTADRGLIDAVATGRLNAVGDHTLQVDVHRFWTAAEQSSAEARALGWELDLTLPVPLGPTHALLLGYSAFRNGAAAPLAGLGGDGETWHFAYLQATVAFPAASGSRGSAR
ncbi:MAG: alginate export family protein [Gemmatimonadota bacterium]